MIKKKDINFNIVEGVSVHDTYDLNELKKDYLNVEEYSVEDIKAKYGLTHGQWLTALERLKNAGVSPRTNVRYARYYTHINYYGSVKYRVNRWINGKMYYFGRFDSEKEAKKRVEELNRNGWDGLLIE